MSDPLYLIPSLVSVSTAPTVINVSGADRNVSPLGYRAVLNVGFQDHPHNDRIVDPYRDGRSWDAMERGSFWSKWLQRNKYHTGVTVRVYDGYVGDFLEEMQSREYIIDRIAGPSSDGAVQLVAKDILSKANTNKALAPLASPGELSTDINASVTSFSATGAVIADYSATGTVRIGDELMTYTGRAQNGDNVDFTGVTRGTDNTTAEEHDSGENVQWVLEYTDQSPWAVAEDLLTTYANVPASYIPAADWAAEGTTYLPSFTITTKITEPTSVDQLLGELSEQCLFYIWWHEVDKEIKFRAIRGIDVEPTNLNDVSNILAGSFSVKERPDQRISQIWTHYQQRNPVEQLETPKNYATTEILANLESEGENKYGERSVKQIYSRWLKDRNVVLDLNTKTLLRYVETPLEAMFQLDAKDRGVWTGDVVRVSHFALVDEHGAQTNGLWRVISAEEAVPGEIITLTLESAALDNIIVVYMDVGDPDYTGSGDQWNGAWYADADGLMSNGDAGMKYA